MQLLHRGAWAKGYRTRSVAGSTWSQSRVAFLYAPVYLPVLVSNAWSVQRPIIFCPLLQVIFTRKRMVDESYAICSTVDNSFCPWCLCGECMTRRAGDGPFGPSSVAPKQQRFWSTWLRISSALDGDFDLGHFIFLDNCTFIVVGFNYCIVHSKRPMTGEPWHLFHLLLVHSWMRCPCSPHL